MTTEDYLKLFEYEYWANLTILENYLTHPSPPERAKVLVSHIIAAQRVWIDRILGKDATVLPFEVFEDKSLLELFEINYKEFVKITKPGNYDQLINYKNTEGKSFIKSIGEILTHLNLHSAYHRGQIVLLLKLPDVTPPKTDFIFYV